jgi:hypothetical protein
MQLSAVPDKIIEYYFMDSSKKSILVENDTGLFEENFTAIFNFCLDNSILFPSGYSTQISRGQNSC